MQIADKARALSVSQTVAITSKANKMKREGIDVIALSAGEPDFDTPDYIKEAAIQAIRDGFTKYTAATGTDELKQAIVEYYYTNNGLRYQPDQITVCSGGKHAIFNAVLATLNEGDEVLIPAPYWVTYPEVIKLVGAKGVIIPTTERTDFKITAQDLAGALTPASRMLILNSPSNPTGSVYNRAELTGLAEVAAKHDLYLLTDEIYEMLVYDGEEHVSIASLEPDLPERCLVVNGASKSFSMTGWRLGWVAAPAAVAQVIAKIQSQATHHPSSITQKAGVAALKGDRSFLKQWVAEFDRRRRYVVDRLNAIKGLGCLLPKGAFYVFPSMADLTGKRAGQGTIRHSVDFCNFLLDEARVAVVPGSAFGAEGYFRISYAASQKDLATALDRMEQAIGRLS